MSLRTPLGRVLGAGPAREGVKHWWVQRLTSIALLPLGIWFAVSLIALPLGDYAVLIEWAKQSFNPLLLLAFALVATWHSKLGVQVIIEDYVHTDGVKTLAVILNLFIHIAIAAAVLHAVLKIAL